MKKISKNLNKRLQLIKESNNYMRTLVNNGYKIPDKLITEHKEQLKICKQLLKQELIKTNIKDIL